MFAGRLGRALRAPRGWDCYSRAAPSPCGAAALMRRSAAPPSSPATPAHPFGAAAEGGVPSRRSVERVEFQNTAVSADHGNKALRRVAAKDIDKLPLRKI